ADSTTLGAAVENARSSATGVTLTSAQATAYAVRALQLLRDVALTSGNVYVVTDAQSALTLALNDTRDEVVTGAAAVLALIDNVEAQTALAELALDNTRTVNIRGAAMNSLADSATAYGNLLDDRVV